MRQRGKRICVVVMPVIAMSFGLQNHKPYGQNKRRKPEDATRQYPTTSTEENISRFLKAQLSTNLDTMLVPSRLSGTATTVIPVSVFGSFTIQAGASPSLAAVPQLIIFNVMNGTRGLLRYLPYSYQGVSSVAIPGTGIAAEPVPGALPWVPAADNGVDQIQLNPKLNVSPAPFILGRIIRFYITIQTNATSVVSAAITGQVTSANIPDTTYVQNFTESEILAFGVPAKDGVAAVPIQEGVWWGLASDWSDGMMPLMATNNESTVTGFNATGGDKSSFQRLSISSTTSRQPSVVQASPYVSSVWVSPLTNAVANSATYNGASVHPTPIGLQDCPMIRVEYTHSTGAAAGAGQITMMHVFSYRLGTDPIATNIARYEAFECAAVSDPNAGLTPDQFPAVPPLRYVESRTMLPDGTTWIGTLVSLLQPATTLVDGTLSGVSVVVQGLNNLENGHRGPVRVAYVSGLNPGQTYQVGGQIDVEAEFASSYSNLTRSALSVPVDTPAVLATQRLYNDSQWPFKRIMRMSDFNRLYEHADEVIAKYLEYYPVADGNT